LASVSDSTAANAERVGRGLVEAASGFMSNYGARAATGSIRKTAEALSAVVADARASGNCC